MHAYLPAIGFGQIKKKSQLQQLLSSVQNFPDQVQKIRLDEESCLYKGSCTRNRSYDLRRRGYAGQLSDGIL